MNILFDCQVFQQEYYRGIGRYIHNILTLWTKDSRDEIHLLVSEFQDIPDTLKRAVTLFVQGFRF